MSNGLKVLVDYALKAIDLTRRNRLLKFPKNAKSITFNMDLTTFVSRFGSLDEFSIKFLHSQILSQENNSLFSDDTPQEKSYIPPTDSQGEKLIDLLNTLRLDAKRKYEEYGLNTLFLTIGKVKWKKPSIKSMPLVDIIEKYDYNSPLLLIPIRIEERKSPKETVVYADLEAHDISLNKVLAQLLKQKEYNASPLSFNQDSAESLIDSYQKLYQQANEVFSELELEFKITHEIQIGQYSYAGQQIYQDLEDNKHTIIEQAVISALCTHSPIKHDNLDVTVDNPDALLNLENDFNVIDADRSQLQVIQKVINGKHLNIQGPPGTGKTQTIVNIIANLLARKKTVLVVSEKHFALQVLVDRLREANLDKLCLSLFDHKADKKTFASSIVADRDSVIKITETEKNKDLNFWFSTRTKHIKNLRSYAMTLGETIAPLDNTLHWVHGEFIKYENFYPDKRIPWQGTNPLEMTSEKYLSLTSILNDMASVSDIASKNEFNYWNKISRSSPPPDFTINVKQALRSLRLVLSTANNITLNFSNIKALYDALEKIINNTKNLNEQCINIKNVDPEEALYISEKFKDKFNNFFRYFHLEYYTKCNIIKTWIINDRPKSYHQYVNVLKTIEEYFKLENLEHFPLLATSNMSQWFVDYNKSIGYLIELFGNRQVIDLLEELSLSNAIAAIDGMIEDREGLEKTIAYQRHVRQLQELGQDWFLDEIKRNPVSNPVALFATSLWSAWLAAYYGQNPVLQKFTIEDHKRTITEFKKTEQSILKANAFRILELYAPDFKQAKKINDEEDRQLTKQSQLKRHKPIRQLVQEIGPLLLKYKPCWMMNPLSLSSYLPYESLKFDVVIFDEASQVQVEHSLGAIARAKQVIIFGDEQQLPPTSFFKHSDEDETTNQEENYESILNAAKEIFPGSDDMLSYHYRSKCEDLIAFSNHHVYNDQLNTFPDADKSQKAVLFEFVKEGLFDRGNTRTNPIEAQRVIEICNDKATNFPNKSLGVISFSQAQEKAIGNALKDFLEKNPQSPLDKTNDTHAPFFIKNLESVQGDERDIIVLSVGYGRDKRTTEVYNGFGPINGQHGYRRLNVAVTRAREQIICVSSINSSDIKNTTKSRGARFLKDYLEYAENHSYINSNQIKTLAISQFEDEVKKTLEGKGYTVHSQIGASGFKIDLAIVNPQQKDKYILGIECDGPSYHASYSARMNDRKNQDTLEARGWKLYRIWSQDWIAKKEDIVEDIIRMLSS